MCRIAGFWDFQYQHSYEKDAVIQTMRDTMRHGGPDSAGYYVDENTPLALGHRRLSIIDLSPNGHQPMFFGDYTIVFNGEIYNYQEVRLQLKQLGCTFTTDSDTEVVLVAFAKWGKQMVQYFRGMFAFAIWHRKQQKLTLCRDRVGVKPLYYYWKDGLFMFASELKALHQHPKFDKAIDFEAVSVYLQQGYIPQPYSIYSAVRKLKPGHYLELNQQQKLSEEKYWSVRDIYLQDSISNRSEGDLTEELEELLTESFKYRMVADVPVGAFLSGGVDSSLVAALLQKNSNIQLKTFTIGFDNEHYNEAQHAKAVAKHIGTEHHEYYCTDEDFKTVIPMLPDMYDEPYADSSAIPTYLVSKMAREKVTVSLSADGGDELFGGYTKYEITASFYPKVARMPKVIRSVLGKIGGRIDPNWLNENRRLVPILRNYTNINNKYPKLINALKAENSVDFFNISSTYLPKKNLTQIFPIYKSRWSAAIQPKKDHLISFLGLIDTETYLEGDILTKVDRATMAVALEGRDPLLDQKLFEFALRLGDQHKIKGTDSKHLLRNVLYKYVPRELIERPKQGFSVPIEQWLRSILRDEIVAIQNDIGFHQRFQLDTAVLQHTCNNFFNQNRYVNPNFIWILYNLYKWDLRWNNT